MSLNSSVQSIPSGKSASAARAAIFEMSRFLAKPWLLLAQFTGILVLRSIGPVANAFLMRSSLDYITAGDSSRFFMSGFLLIASYGLEAAATTVGVYLRISVLESVAASSRVRFIKRIMAMPFDEYERLSKGDLVSVSYTHLDVYKRQLTMIARVFMGDEALTAMAGVNSPTGFTDDWLIPGWARPAVNYALNREIVSIKDFRNLAPDQYSSRAMCCRFLSRFVDAKDKNRPVC